MFSTLLIFSLRISEVARIFFSFLSDHGGLYPPTDVLKILRSLGKSRESQISSLVSKEKVNKAWLMIGGHSVNFLTRWHFLRETNMKNRKCHIRVSIVYLHSPNLAPRHLFTICFLVMYWNNFFFSSARLVDKVSSINIVW